MNLKELDDKAKRTAYLIAAFIQKKLTPVERKELDEWIAEDESNQTFFDGLTNEKNIGRMSKLILRSSFNFSQGAGEISFEERIRNNPEMIDQLHISTRDKRIVEEIIINRRSLRKVGKDFGISGERVRQICAAASINQYIGKGIN
ncbi:MAG TPA: hypothetical protein VL095_05120 [Flavisolibacter sp.]|nr:hypothetical protein [Flavisolibacter sp.]